MCIETVHNILLSSSKCIWYIIKHVHSINTTRKNIARINIIKTHSQSDSETHTETERERAAHTIHSWEIVSAVTPIWMIPVLKKMWNCWVLKCPSRSSTHYWYVRSTMFDPMCCTVHTSDQIWNYIQCILLAVSRRIAHKKWLLTSQLIKKGKKKRTPKECSKTVIINISILCLCVHNIITLFVVLLLRPSSLKWGYN